MKKLLLVLMLPCAVFGAAKKPAVASMPRGNMAGHFIDFITMEQQHAQDWLKFKQERADAKIAMLIGHKDQLFGLKKENAQKLSAAGMPVEAYFQEMLQAWIRIHKQQKEDWKKLCAQDHEKGQALYEKHKAELSQFEQRVGLPEAAVKWPLLSEHTDEQIKTMLKHNK